MAHHTIHDLPAEKTFLPRASFNWTPKSVVTWTTTTSADQPLPWDEDQPSPPGTAPDQADIVYTNSNTELTFEATVEVDEGDYIIAYEWDFGDGIKGYGQEVKHTYVQTTESMRVSLCVIDNHRRKVCIGRQAIITPAESLGVGEGFILAPEILFNGDYETGNLSQYYPPQEQTAGRVSVVTTPTPAQGTYAGRFQVNSGDNVPGAGGARAEMVAEYFHEGQEVWIGWSTRIPTATTGGDGKWRILMQIHQSSPAGSPPFVLHWLDTSMKWRFTNGANNLATPVWTSLSAVTRDVWHNFQLHMVISASAGTGSCQLWYSQGAAALTPQTLDAGGTTRLLVTGDEGSYLKTGLYRDPTTTTTDVVYHDKMRVATSQALLNA